MQVHDPSLFGASVDDLGFLPAVPAPYRGLWGFLYFPPFHFTGTAVIGDNDLFWFLHTPAYSLITITPSLDSTSFRL